MRSFFEYLIGNKGLNTEYMFKIHGNVNVISKTGYVLHPRQNTFNVLIYTDFVSVLILPFLSEDELTIADTTTST